MMEIPRRGVPIQKENIMGKPIQKKWFGPATLSGSQIVVDGVKFADGTTATGAYIVKQTGSAAYIVQDSALAHDPEIVFMVNATAVGGLNPSECFITAVPFGGSAVPCAKIAQYRVDLYEADGSVDSYSWSTLPADAPGEADLITTAGAGGAILSITPGAAGFGYFTAPSVTFTGGGAGGAAHTTVLNGAVATYVIDSAGIGYDGGMIIDAPSAPVTATCATGFAVAGVVTTGSIAVTLPGGYYAVAPVVTVVGGDGTATAHATVVAGAVATVIVDTGGTAGYTTPVGITIAAPPAAVQATASATVSV